METTTAKLIFRLLEATGLVLLTVVKVKKRISLKFLLILISSIFVIKKFLTTNFL